MNDEPLIWTSKGNLPISSLKYETYWHDMPETLKFVERYSLGDEIVRESAHIFVKRGTHATGQQGIF